MARNRLRQADGDLARRLERSVARFYGLSVAELRSGRDRRRCYARNLAMHLAHAEAGLTYLEVASLYGRAERTAWSGIQRVRRALAKNEVARRQAAALAKEARK